MNRSLCVRGCTVLLVAALATMSGCGPNNGLSLVKVSGKVTFKGQPIQKGTVFFMPDEGKGTIGPPAVGSITSDGSYIMSTESAGDGVVVGEHRIGLTGMDPTPVSGPVEEIDPQKDAGGYMSAKSKAAQASKGAPKEAELFTDKGGKKYRFIIPAKLSRPLESGIRVKIDRSRTLNFDVDESGTVRVTP